MHYHVEVMVPAEEAETAEQAIARAEERIAQYGYSEFDEDRWARWDWYMVGGRWRGVHVDGRTPFTDDLERETCNLCEGTGVHRGVADRTAPFLREADGTLWSEERIQAWLEWSGGCNGCRGEGSQLPWPTQWDPHPLDACRNSEAHRDLLPYAYVDLNGEWVETSGADERMNRAIAQQVGVEGGDTLTEVEAPRDDWRPEGEYWLVTIDCHN